MDSSSNDDGPIHILTCGSVDDGKSTLLGRLLWDAGDLPEDTRAAILASRKPDGQPDLSLLLDGLVAEREQGITIDIAWRYFDSLGGRRFVIIDSPGHEQYTRNMASGASHADVAMMLVDAREGIKPQTRRHLAILNLLGVRQVILCVNKMDLVLWSGSRFRGIEASFKALVSQFGFERSSAIPISAKYGDNVAHKSANARWYAGRTLIEELAAARGGKAGSDEDFNMPVQLVVRRDDFRGLAGTVGAGVVRPGDPVRDVLSGRDAHVARIVTMDGDLAEARQGQAVVLELDRDLDISRGGVLAALQSDLTAVNRLQTRLVWLADSPWDGKSRLLLRTASDLAPIQALSIKSRLDLDTLEETEATACGANDIVEAAVTLARPAVAASFTSNRTLGGFVIVDAISGNTLAGGTIAAASLAAHVARPVFRLSKELLADGLCKGLSPTDEEFRRRAKLTADILAAAGVPVEIAL